MRIVHLTNAYAPHSGGIRTTAHALGRGYRDAGHDLTLVVPGPKDDESQYDWGTLVQLAGPPVPGTRGYRALVDVRRVRRTLEALAPDRVEISDRFTLRPLGAWATAAGIPALLIAHERLDGLLSTVAHLPNPLARALADRHNRTSARRFPRIVATTTFAAAEFDRIGVPTEHVPLGVDLSRFSPRLRASKEDGVVTLVVCSRLSPEKRPDLVVRALPLLLRAGVPARLVVAGDGPSMARLRASAAGLPVDFLGHVPDRENIARLLAAADVMLAPGPIETFGLAALEALASGTPVVAARSSALAELVAPDAGACAAPTPAAFAAAVRTVLARPVEVRRTAARRRAEAFPWSRTVTAMLAVHGAASTRAAA